MKFLYKKRRNSKISVRRREELIQSVLQHGRSINYAAKKLRLKYSTARIIINKFKETGHIFIKDMRRQGGRQNAVDPIPSSNAPGDVEAQDSISPEIPQSQPEIPEPLQRQSTNCFEDSPVVWYFYPYYSWAPCS